ncbi:MAG: hypothetical protein J6Q58_03945 [Clostridia bacterium]|nr:hypothetical protein [Clostridia bacterium]
MTAFEKYSLIVSLIVFLLLTLVSIFVVVTIYKQTLKLIKCGAEDEKIVKEYQKNKNNKHQKLTKALDFIVTLILVVLLFIGFGTSIYVKVTGEKYYENMPSFQVVKTGSMAKKHQKNTYLTANGLDNQIQTFDLIATYKAPKEEDIKLYDIVVYEVDDVLLVHRVVQIEEPNEKHPNERWFLCQGDAVEKPDRFPVKYSQIKGIYKNERIPFVGSFILFMQSPAGWLCIALVLVAVIATPILEKSIKKQTHERLVALGVIDDVVINVNNAIAEESEIAVTEEPEIAVTSEPEKKGLNIEGNDNRTFIEKIKNGNAEVKNRYAMITTHLARIEGARVIKGNKRQIYKKGNTGIALLNMRGKTLCVNLALNPKDYENTKYIYKDVRNVKAYVNYPMRVKITSNRQARWAKELIGDIVTKNNFTLSKEEKPFSFSGLKAVKKTFKQRLRKDNKESADRLKQIASYLKEIDKVTEKQTNEHRVYKIKGKPLAKVIVKGKTVCLCLAISPRKLEGTKYVYKDVSSVKKHAKYPTIVKLTSNRQVKWAKELINKIVGVDAL